MKLNRTEASGKRVILGLREPGWLLGAVAVLTGRPYVATAETITRCEVCSVPPDRFLRAMETNASFSRWVARILCGGEYAGLLRISGSRRLSGRQRLERFLLEVIGPRPAPKPGKATGIPVPLEDSEVAPLLSLAPAHLRRLVRQMEDEGVLARRKGRMVVLDPERLRNPETSSRK